MIFPFPFPIVALCVATLVLLGSSTPAIAGHEEAVAAIEAAQAQKGPQPTKGNSASRSRVSPAPKAPDSAGEGNKSVVQSSGSTSKQSSTPEKATPLPAENSGKSTDESAMDEGKGSPSLRATPSKESPPEQSPPAGGYSTDDYILAAIALSNLVIVVIVGAVYKRLRDLATSVELNNGDVWRDLQIQKSQRRVLGDSIKDELRQYAEHLGARLTELEQIQRDMEPAARQPRKNRRKAEPSLGEPVTSNFDSSPLLAKSIPQIDSLIDEFCRDQINHTSLLNAAESQGVRWGSGTAKPDGRVTVQFGNAENRILVLENPHRRSDYYVLVKEDAHWNLDLAFVFDKEDDVEPGLKDDRVRTRRAAKGKLEGDNEISIEDRGEVAFSRS